MPVLAQARSETFSEPVRTAYPAVAVRTVGTARCRRSVRAQVAMTGGGQRLGIKASVCATRAGDRLPAVKPLRNRRSGGRLGVRRRVHRGAPGGRRSWRSRHGFHSRAANSAALSVRVWHEVEGGKRLLLNARRPPVQASSWAVQAPDAPFSLLFLVAKWSCSSLILARTGYSGTQLRN